MRLRGAGLMASLNEALATLATVPPKAFTRQRDALAARLREAGDTTTAAQVKARRVPTVPVWVVNRLALEHPDDVQALIAAAERVKAAQLGRGQAGMLATATAGHRAALERLRARAGVMLRDAGGGATPDKLLRVQHTLTAAAVDAQARTALQAGHLERELTAPGFDVFGGARPPATRRTQRREGARPRAETAAPPARIAAAAPPAAAKADERRRTREAARAARQERMARARTALTEAQRQAVAAHKDATEAAGRLNELLEQAQQARRALRERTTAARQQDVAVRHAQRALRSAERKAGP
jgi:hypothetical protein